ncbi:hypothetical protein ACQ3I4_02120 [Zafaria sp. Z1313]|uniref:hypothetical protein n=1 Tax=unclassified Zafaria TaxID=2828765 RepID=UPI002E777D3C|nr:hypothetical protein [Zafaria sp. J156]MEE1620169.1 hypothetical protein [Zafaria sp. J156]
MSGDPGTGSVAAAVRLFRDSAPRRILIHGTTGSGKSTLALELGAVLGLPVHLVDEEFGWLPDWQPRPVDEQRRMVFAAASAPWRQPIRAGGSSSSAGRARRGPGSAP